MTAAGRLSTALGMSLIEPAPAVTHLRLYLSPPPPHTCSQPRACTEQSVCFPWSPCPLACPPTWLRPSRTWRAALRCVYRRTHCMRCGTAPPVLLGTGPGPWKRSSPALLDLAGVTLPVRLQPHVCWAPHTLPWLPSDSHPGSRPAGGQHQLRRRAGDGCDRGADAGEAERDGVCRSH